ncbi:MAG: hypothetical protein V4515_07605 [Chloroflexota bacterium]
MRRRRFRVGLLVALAVALSGVPASTLAAPSEADQLSADLDGKPIQLVDVGNWYCDDFSYPAIHCFRDPKELEARATLILATTAIDYVTVYDQTTFAGSYMHMSEDYTVLALIGWNDRVSSLKGRNSQSGHFYVDWFFGGAIFGFCCNQQLTSLGSYDNTFSSVHRG